MKTITKYVLAIVALFGIQASLAASKVTVRNMTGERIAFTVVYGSGSDAIKFIEPNKGVAITHSQCWTNFLVWPTAQFNPGPKTGLTAKLVVPRGSGTDKCGTTYWKITKTTRASKERSGMKEYEAIKVSSVKDLS